MPDSSVDIFSDRMTDILNTVNKENKLFYMLGDLNIDLLKYEEHRLISSFLDMFYSNNVFPLITKPTRMTQTTATLIDHVLTNNFDVWGKHRQGILCTDISDHNAVFHIAGNTMCKSKDCLSPTVKRDLSHRNVQKFIDEMQQVDWQIVTEIREPQNAYNQLHNIISKTYDTCFPYKKVHYMAISTKSRDTLQPIKRKINYMSTEIEGLTLNSNGKIKKKCIIIS